MSAKSDATDNKQRRKQAIKKLEHELNSRDRAEKLKPVGVVVATLAILLVFVGGIWFLTTLDSNEVACEYPADDFTPAAREVTTPPTEDVPTEGTVTVTLETNQGNIPMVLDREKAPCGVNAIEHLAKSGYYDDTVCHRLTEGGLNVLQCGDPTGTGSGGPGFTFAGEYPITDGDALSRSDLYIKGTIAMANPSDPNRNGSQFFLNYEDSTLDANYTILGNMTDEGTQVVQDIASKGIDSEQSGSEGDGAPREEVRINSVTVSE